MQLGRKVALITGTAKGFGKAFAESLLRNGAKVCLSDVDVELGNATYEKFRTEFGDSNVSFTPCDVRNHHAMKDMFDKVKREHKTLDLMVNNAGIANEQQIDATIDINLRGVIYGTMLAMDLMRTDRGGNGGVVVNVASMAGLFPVPHVPVYAATKHGVIGFTRSWAENPVTTSNGIRLVCLGPAYTDTDIIKEQKVQGDDIANNSIKQLGVMSVSTVVDGFLQVIRDTDNNGKVLCIAKNKAPTYK